MYFGNRSHGPPGSFFFDCHCPKGKIRKSKTECITHEECANPTTTTTTIPSTRTEAEYLVKEASDDAETPALVVDLCRRCFGRAGASRHSCAGRAVRLAKARRAGGSRAAAAMRREWHPQRKVCLNFCCVKTNIFFAAD